MQDQERLQPLQTPPTPEFRTTCPIQDHMRDVSCTRHPVLSFRKGMT